MQDFKDLSAEELQAILSGGASEDSSNDALVQMMMLQKLRGQQPALEGRQAGRVYVANNPLEHLGSFMKNRQMDKKQSAMEEALGNSRAQGQRHVDALGKAAMGPPAGPPMAAPEQASVEGNVPMPNIQMEMAQQLRGKAPRRRPAMPTSKFPMKSPTSFEEPSLEQLLNANY
jgi:hypothetical protein